ncbi:MAG TPA: hypothetical protein VIJ12_07700 [Candidatus Baltobacteraceae bacterium]
MSSASVGDILAGTAISAGVAVAVVLSFVVLWLLSYSLRGKRAGDVTEPRLREALGKFSWATLLVSIASIFVAFLPIYGTLELRFIDVLLGIIGIIAVNRTRADLASPNLRERGLSGWWLLLIVPCASCIGVWLAATLFVSGGPFLDARSALQMIRVAREIPPGTPRSVAYDRLRAEHLVAFNYDYAHATEDSVGDFERFDEGPWPDPSRTPTPVMMQQGEPDDGLDPAHPFALVKYRMSTMILCTAWQIQRITFDNQDRVRAIVNDGPPENLCP